MRTISFAEFQADDARILESVADECEQVIVERPGHESVVIVRLDDYRLLQKSARKLSGFENPDRTLRAIIRLEANGGTQHPLIE